jgi:hypothetical protein
MQKQYAQSNILNPQQKQEDVAGKPPQYREHQECFVCDVPASQCRFWEWHSHAQPGETFWQQERCYFKQLVNFDAARNGRKKKKRKKKNTSFDEHRLYQKHIQRMESMLNEPTRAERGKLLRQLSMETILRQAQRQQAAIRGWASCDQFYNFYLLPEGDEQDKQGIPVETQTLLETPNTQVVREDIGHSHQEQSSGNQFYKISTTQQASWHYQRPVLPPYLQQQPNHAQPCGYSNYYQPADVYHHPPPW